MHCPHCPHCTRPATRPQSVYEIRCDHCEKDFQTNDKTGDCPHCGTAFEIVSAR